MARRIHNKPKRELIQKLCTLPKRQILYPLMSFSLWMPSKKIIVLSILTGGNVSGSAQKENSPLVSRREIKEVMYPASASQQ